MHSTPSPLEKFAQSLLQAEVTVDAPQVDAAKLMFDAERADSMGPDPFGLRTSPRDLPISNNLSDILRNPDINLIVPTKPINMDIDDPQKTGLQPIQTLWVGGNLTDNTRLENLRKLKRLNPNTEIVLWVHQLGKIDKNSPMLKTCQELGVHVIPIEKVFGNKLPNPHQIAALDTVDPWAIHMIGMLKSMYGWSSDIMRYVYLYMFGGVHCDLDSIPRKSLENLEINSSVLITPANPGYYNDPLAAQKFSPAMANAIIEVDKRARRQWRALLNIVPIISPNILFKEKKETTYTATFNQIDIGNYLKNMFASEMDLERAQTIITTGANALVQQFGFESGKSVPEENIFPEGLVEVQCANAWISKSLLERHFEQHFPKDKERAIKVVLTNILYDLQHEPRFLFIDKYKSLCKKYGIGDIVFDILTQPEFRKYLTKITHVSIFNSCSERSCSKLLDPTYFPSLKLNQANPSKEEIDYYLNRATYGVPSLGFIKFLHKQYPNEVAERAYPLINYYLGQDNAVPIINYLFKEVLQGQIDLSKLSLTLPLAEGNIGVIACLINNNIPIDKHNQLGDKFVKALAYFRNNCNPNTDQIELCYDILTKLIKEKKLFDPYSYFYLSEIIANDNNVQPLDRMLLETMDEVNIIGAGGNTPLHLAIIKGDIELIKRLLNKKACVDIVNNKGETPFSLAERLSNVNGGQYPEIFDLVYQKISSTQNQQPTLQLTPENKDLYHYARLKQDIHTFCQGMLVKKNHVAELSKVFGENSQFALLLKEEIENSIKLIMEKMNECDSDYTLSLQERSDILRAYLSEISISLVVFASNNYTMLDEKAFLSYLTTNKFIQKPPVHSLELQDLIGKHAGLTFSISGFNKIAVQSKYRASENPIYPYVGEIHSPLETKKLLTLLKNLNLQQQLTYLEEVFTLIRENPSNLYATKSSSRLSNRQIGDIKTLQKVYLEIIKNSLGKGLDAKKLEEIQITIEVTRTRASLVDFENQGFSS